ncbi:MULTISPECIES: hypothetical protein [unclassified Streptomyces]|uniref:hypothetical protein n=1 Tax=unclassified Streptomyces TaxID=2593676 RepID=UPI001BE7971B|nr:MULTISPECIES: hypothetical protein [unclassified Streptomyces]MBT2402883.1 hypothetical protein [Streptomyces sp. ISL-21]MBT2612011.1 hypothetical protein [Streptomyces sp. ISL-87]
MVTRETGRNSGIRGRVGLAAAGVALALGAAVSGLAIGALSDGSGSHLRLGDVGWNSEQPHVVAGDVGWNSTQPGPAGDVGWN